MQARVFLHREAQMGYREKHDDKKIIAAIACLFIGFLFVWNVSAHISDYYELHLDAGTCNRVKTLGLMPSADCTITAPYRPTGLGQVGYLVLPDGNDIQIAPVAANRTNKSAEWSTSMKVQLWVVLLFWAATLALLLNAFRSRK